MSGRAEGIACRVDETELPRAGLYPITEADEGQMKLVERTLADSYSEASAGAAAPSAIDPVNRSSCLP